MKSTIGAGFWRRVIWILFILGCLFIIASIAVTIYTPKPSRIIAIGLDGADWDIINPLIEAGRLPNIKRIVDGGTTGKLVSIEPTSSPALWTTLSTGVRRETHGIKGFTIPGKGNQPYNSGFRQVPAVWNIVSLYKGHVGVVGHRVSWPAEEINGEMVSSYVSYNKDDIKRLGHKGKLRAQADIPKQTHPPGLFEELRQIITTPADVSHKDIDRFFEIDDWDDPDLHVKEIGASIDYIMPWTFSADKTHTDVFFHIWENKEPYDFLFTYIQGTDIACHRYWHFYNTEYLEKAMEFWEYDLEAKDKYIHCFSDTINRYYEWSDEVIGKILDSMGSSDTLVIYSDHGFGKYDLTPKGYAERVKKHTFSGAHGHIGAIMFYGANIKKGHRLKGPPPDLTDVLPTFLTLMKLPVVHYMEGAPIRDAFDSKFARMCRTKYVDSYGIEDQFGLRTTSSPLDEELKKRLQSLGYIN